MLKRYVITGLPSIALVLASLLLPYSAAVPDPIDDAVDLPATPEETRFIDVIVSAVDEAAPEIDGWQRDVDVYASGNAVHEGQTTLIYSRARDFPLKVSVQVNYRQLTEADAKEAAFQQTGEQLKEQMMAAAMQGNVAEMERLQQEMAALMQSRMEGGAMGQAAGVTPMQPREKPKKFHVQFIVNGEGESIGKQYDFAAPDVTKAFRVDKGSDDFLTYRYYLGDWTISELDQKNWRVVDSADAQTADNHLRALVASVSVYGDRDSVEDFVGKRLDLARLNRVVD